METKVIREKLHQLIDEMDDKKAEKFYSFLMGEFETGSFRKQLIRYEREKFLQGEGVSFSWEEVRQIAENGLLD